MKSSLTCAALALFLLASPCRAATFHLTGEWAAHNEVVILPFTLDADADVRIWTDSFLDGRGVDPLLALWNADGGLIDWNDDDATLAPATQTQGDAGLFFTPLAAGDYVLSLTGLGNIPWGSALSDGFAYDLDAPDRTFGASPGWSVWLSAPGLTVSDVPEPPTPALFAAGLLLMLAGKRRQAFLPMQRRIP
jgi:hypothetical protein